MFFWGLLPQTFIYLGMYKLLKMMLLKHKEPKYESNFLAKNIPKISYVVFVNSDTELL